MKRLTKSSTNIKLDGVCGGIAEYIGIDPVLVRVLWVIFCLAGGSGVLAYIACAILMPRAGSVPYAANHKTDASDEFIDLTNRKN